MKVKSPAQVVVPVSWGFSCEGFKRAVTASVLFSIGTLNAFWINQSAVRRKECEDFVIIDACVDGDTVTSTVNA